MVPSSGNCLQNEAFLREADDVASFADFLCGEAVAVGGKIPVCVWLVEPGLIEEAGLDFGELEVYWFRDASRVNVEEK